MSEQRDSKGLPRRDFLRRAAAGAAGMGIAGNLSARALRGVLPPGFYAGPAWQDPAAAGLPGLPHFAPKAKRIIYLFQSGAPSQIDLFDPKPGLNVHYDEELPDSIRKGQRITTMTSGQARFPVAPSIFGFAPRGQCGTELSDLLPHTSSIVDKIALVRTLHTDAINHDPAITYIQTGAEQPGRPSLGAWLDYGLGTGNPDLPGYVVMITRGSAVRDPQALFSRLWGTGFLPSQHQGVTLRPSGDPVLYLSNPAGVDRDARRRMLDALGRLNDGEHARHGDPETATRTAQYEMAYRMQESVPKLADFSKEPDEVLDLYGPEVRKPGTYAYNCLMARRLAERGVRCIQLFHRGWDQHGDLPRDLALQVGDVDQPSAGLVKDLERLGLLEDTLVVFGGEFGRTVYCQGGLSRENYGRDHHPRCFSVWMAGGGIKGGVAHGKTDDFSYNIEEDPVHVHDLNATLLHCLGIDHERLTYRFQGRDFRLTDVHGKVVRALLA